jgi:GT2 family glycosyltransferase
MRNGSARNDKYYVSPTCEFLTIMNQFNPEIEVSAAPLSSRTNGVRPAVSIVIVSFNTRDVLRECLQTLARRAGAISYETVVIDNNSRDGSAEMVEAEFTWARVFRCDRNLGFAGANNRGFAKVTGRYVVLLNSDAFLQPGALERAVDRMDKNPLVALAGGRLVGRDGAWQPSARMFPSLLNELLVMSGLSTRYSKSRFFGRVDRTFADPSEPAPVDWVPGAFSIIRRDLLEKIGYFDERFFLYYEEVDLCRRLKAAGYQIWYWPDVEVVHLGGESSKTIKHIKISSSGSQLELWRMRSRLLYYRKHHGAFGARSALMVEEWWNRLRLMRNLISSRAQGRLNADDSRASIATLRQAWADTQGGKTSPPQPW